MAIISEKNIDMILFNKPYLVGNEQDAGRGHLSGNGCRANSTFRKNLYFQKK
jgi:methylase of polypeptide subunit release factors